MSFTVIPNQPISLDTLDSVTCGDTSDDTCIAFAQTDTTVFQVLLDLEAEEIPTASSEFTSSTGWTEGTGWAIDTVTNKRAECTGNGDLTYALSSISANQYFQITFNVEFSGGEITVSFGGEDIFECDIDTGSGSTIITTSGSYELYHLPCNPSNSNLVFTSSGSPTLITIDNVQVKELVPPTVHVKDYCDDSTVYTPVFSAGNCTNNACDFVTRRKYTASFDTNSALTFKFYQRYMNVIMDWSDASLDDGTYYFTADGISSNCFYLLTNPESCCYRKVSWGINTYTDYLSGNPIQGFSFGSSEDFIMRIPYKLYQPRWQDDYYDTYKNSAGIRSLTSSRTSRIIKMKTGRIPELAHNAIAVALKHPKFQLEDISYVTSEDTYSPNWNEISDLAYSVVELYRKTEDLQTTC